MKTGRTLRIAVGIAGLLALSAAFVYFTLPINRINMHSRLVMLGDFNGDGNWNGTDARLLAEIIAKPFEFAPEVVYKADVNHNGMLDDEDVAVLSALYKSGDPYKLKEKQEAAGHLYPYPRDFFRYRPGTEYIQRPLVAFKHAAAKESPLKFLRNFPLRPENSYAGRLRSEIYDEGIRFTLAYNKREAALNAIEREYSDRKLARCNMLWKNGREYDLLLELMGLTEDAETLTTAGQRRFVAQLLYFRDDLVAFLQSPRYGEYKAGNGDYHPILAQIGYLLKKDLGMNMDLATVPPPRDFLKPDNYVDRFRWQYYKSAATRADFRKFLLFAQYDRRYLRAAARTTRKLDDTPETNHNLPMALLFRGALNIKNGDKFAAVGLIDEAVRIPFSWLKSLPANKLPSSIALENFLLPGNKEDGSDKTRHWNVFGGISLYKSPEESLRLGLAREIKDFRDANRTPAAMTEFIRDSIANINGIYYVMTINPALVYKIPIQ